MFSNLVLDNFFAFIIVLFIVVVVHEYGHYLFARLCGVTVEVFSIGFGKEIVSFIDRNKTVWRLSWIPLGGFVKIKGQDASFEEEEIVKINKNDKTNFMNKTALQKIFIVFAGPLFNIFLSVAVIFTIFSLYGKPNFQPVILEILPGSVIEKYGIIQGDKIVELNHEKITSVIQLVNQLSKLSDNNIVLSIDGASGKKDVNIVLNSDKKLGVKLGVVPNERLKISSQEAFTESIRYTNQIIKLCLVGIKQLLTGKEKITNLGGVIQIAQSSGDAIRNGFESFLSIIAFLSVNLAILNLFPIPGLDGGYLVFYILDLFWVGKFIKPKIRKYAVFCGFSILFCLMLIANLNDIFRLIKK